MKPHLKITVSDSDNIPIIGPGPYQLLLNIDKEKSINKVAKKLKLSYSKAMKMVHNLENKVTEPILKKTIGGKAGGGAELTEFGRKLLEEYRLFSEKLNNAAVAEYSASLKKYFKK